MGRYLGLLAKLADSLMVLVHAALSLVGVLVCDFTFYTFWRPRNPRYVMVVLLLVVVALWGVVVYAKWRDRRAFFAWLVPLLWSSHIFISRGASGFSEGPGELGLTFLAIATAYSLGAVAGAGAYGELHRIIKADSPSLI